MCCSPWDHKELDMTEWLNSKCPRSPWKKGSKFRQIIRKAETALLLMNNRLCYTTFPPHVMHISWLLYFLFYIGIQLAFLVAQMVRNLPEMQVTWILSLDREDPLGKEMATCSSILAWRIPWAEEPGGLQSTGSQRVGHSWATNIFTFNSFKWTAKLLSHTYTCILSLPDFPPIQAAI